MARYKTGAKKTGAKLVPSTRTRVLHEWYPEDQDCVNMLQGSSISSNSWRYMGRSFPNWLKYSRIRARRPWFRQSYSSHLSHYSYLLYTHTLFFLQYFILLGYFGFPSSSLSTLPSPYLKLPLDNMHFLPTVDAPFVSPPFQIQTVLCIVVKLLLSAYIDSTFPFNCHFALWFPIVGNKGVGTTIVVVFLPEVT